MVRRFSFAPSRVIGLLSPLAATTAVAAPPASASSAPPTTSPFLTVPLIPSAASLLCVEPLGSAEPLGLAAVEELRPGRPRLAEPEGTHQAHRRDQQPNRRPPAHLLCVTDQGAEGGRGAGPPRQPEGRVGAGDPPVRSSS